MSINFLKDKSNLLKQEGEYVSIKNDKETKGQISLIGNSFQQNRSGKNLVDISLFAKEELNGISYTYENKKIHVEGTATAIAPSSIVNVADKLEVGKKYILSINKSNSDNVIATASIQYNDETPQSWVTSFTFSENMQAVNVYLQVANNTTINVDVTAQLEEGEVATSYEEFGASPNSIFPSPIENTGDNIQLLDNTWSKCVVSAGYPIKSPDSNNTVTITSSNTKELTFSSSNTYQGIMSDFILAKKGEKFTISFESYKNINRMYIEQYDENKSRVSSLAPNTSTISSKTVTATQDGYIIVGFANTEAKNDMKVNKVKLEKGAISTSYSPCDCGNIDITKCNKNLFDGIFSQGYDSNGNITSSNQFVCNTNLINVEENESYTISNNLNLKIVSIAYYKDNIFTGFQSNMNLATITIPQNVNQIRFNLYREPTLDVSNFTFFQFERNTTATNYIEHEEQIITFPLDEGQKMYECSYLADNGIHHKRKQIILDGTETIRIYNWSTPHENTTIFEVGNIISKKSDSIKLCNYFKTVKNTTENLNKDEEYCLSVITGAVWFSVSNEIATTVEQFENWLAQKKQEGKPLIIEYDLLEEEIEEYTEEQQEAYNQLQNITLYKDTTNIFSVNNISPSFKVQYKNTTKYLDFNNNITFLNK